MKPTSDCLASLRIRTTLCLALAALVTCTTSVGAQEERGRTVLDQQRFFVAANQPTGLLIPLYAYPAHIHKNEAFNRVMDLKKKYATVPVCVILNPASGPGEGERDGNYVQAVYRLQGAGIMSLGYVWTNKGQKAIDSVYKDIDSWRARYPDVNGLFLDEMSNDSNAEHVKYYVAITEYAHQAGFWPVFANPGAATPEPYFKSPGADVIVIHENSTYPDEESLRGDYFGGYADYAPFTRAVLVHSSPKFDAEKFAILRKYVRWVYVTHDRFDATADLNDAKNNPWDELSLHLETMFSILAQPPR